MCTRSVLFFAQAVTCGLQLPAIADSANTLQMLRERAASFRQSFAVLWTRPCKEAEAAPASLSPTLILTACLLEAKPQDADKDVFSISRQSSGDYCGLAHAVGSFIQEYGNFVITMYIFCQNPPSEGISLILEVGGSITFKLDKSDDKSASNVVSYVCKRRAHCISRRPSHSPLLHLLRTQISLAPTSRPIPPKNYSSTHSREFCVKRFLRSRK